MKIPDEIKHGIIWPRPGFVPRREIKLRGWCFSDGTSEIIGVRAMVNGSQVFKASRKQPTFAIGLDFPNSEDANYAGYSIPLELPRGRSRVRVECRVAGGTWHLLEDLELFAPWLWEGPERCGFDYKLWVSRYDSRSAWDVDAWREAAETFETSPTFTILIKAGGTVPDLKRSLVSLRTQAYEHWECIVEDGGDLPPLGKMGDRLKISQSVADATGDYITIIEAGDRLAPHALAWVAMAINDAKIPPVLLYSDEDVADSQGQRGNPWFKPSWDPEFLLSRDYLSRSGYFCREYFPHGVPDHRRLAESLYSEDPDAILHIPAVLYHRGTERSYKVEGVRIVNQLSDPLPQVEIIIPTRDNLRLLQSCVDSLTRLTDYRGFSLTVVDNQSSKEDTLAYLASLPDRVPGARVLHFPGAFNFSAINNLAAEESDADVLVFLNNDIEVISRGWLKAMCELAIQERIGAVGAHLLYPDRQIQHAGVFLGYRDYAGHIHKGMSQQVPDLMHRRDVVHQVSAVTAACMAVARDKFLAAGGFDSGFPVSVNDVDLCLKLVSCGYRNVMCADAQLLHRESATRGAGQLSAHRKEETKREMLSLYYRWADMVAEDPFYNPNLSLESEEVCLSDPPRVQTRVTDLSSLSESIDA